MNEQPAQPDDGFLDHLDEQHESHVKRIEAYRKRLGAISMKPVSILQTEVRRGETEHELVLVTTATGDILHRMSVRQAEDNGGVCATMCKVHRNRCATHAAVWNTYCREVQHGTDTSKT